MNERIRELADKAWKEVLSETSIEGDTSNVYSPDEVVAFEQKFAELIVAECMEQVWYTREDSINGNVSEVIKERMKRHFVGTGS
jgi:hypothetical protein